MTNAPSGSIARISAALADRYRIERELGAGGMATVYLAHDIKHERRVAVKVLRPELAAVIGADRFLAEIKTTANLQHPHILALHDSGEADNTVFYVMPYVEGESLRDRLKHEKQLPVDDAIRIAREVASALDYAHRHGVVHRDIKPENILLHDGQALVADFGIALAVSRSEGGTRMTETGMSLGTPHYMAPEQAMGEREITPKADVYALGCVLYEMLTGDPPFTGSTAQAIVARTLTESPRHITTQRHTVPPHVEAAVFTALEKLPADRFATAGEFAAALDNPALARVHTTMQSSAAKRAHDWRTRAALPLAGIALAAVAAAAWALSRPGAPRELSRYAISFPAGQAPLADRPFYVSRSGGLFVYVGPDEGNRVQLWLKPRTSDVATPLAGTTGANRAAFSPADDWIAFVTPDNQLRKLPTIGGAAIPVADSAAPARGVAWLDDESIVFVHAGSVLGRELRRVPSGGGPPETVWRSDSTTTAWNPTALPGARGVLFIECIGGAGCPARRDLVALDLKSGTKKVLVSGAVTGQYLPTGHVLYVRPDGAMLAVGFDLGSFELRGSPVPIRDSVAIGLNNIPFVAVSETGTQFVRVGGSFAGGEIHELVWVDRAGRETPVDTSFTFRLTVSGENRGWALSPDDRQLAIGVNNQGAGDDVWVKQLPSGAARRVTLDSAAEHRPRWSRDGKSITFLRLIAGGTLAVYRTPADGTGSAAPVLRRTDFLYPEALVSPDEKYLLLRGGGAIGVVGGRDILVMELGVDTIPRPLIASPQFDESAMALSPNGRWLAYESNEGGRSDVSIRPFPNVDAARVPVSTNGGRAPLWSRDGRELYYVNANREMMSVAVTPGPTIPTIGTPQRLFRLREPLYLTELERYTPWDITRDGRFIMARRVAQTAAQIAPLIVTENWFEELRALMKDK